MNLSYWAYKYCHRMGKLSREYFPNLGKIYLIFHSHPVYIHVIRNWEALSNAILADMCCDLCTPVTSIRTFLHPRGYCRRLIIVFTPVCLSLYLIFVCGWSKLPRFVIHIDKWTWNMCIGHLISSLCSWSSLIYESSLFSVHVVHGPQLL